MAVRPATESPDSSVIEKTTRTRILPVSEANDNGKTPDLWEYLRTLGAADWQKHMIYVYRAEPAPSVPLLKCADQFLSMPNGQRVAVADEQEVEFALLQNYGGGTFRMIVKKGPQWVTQGRIAINAPVRPITIPVDMSGQPGQGSVNVSGMSDSAQIAGKAIDTIAGAEHQAVRIGMDALNSAANVVRTFAEGRPSGGQDPVMQQIMQSLIARALAPPPDPLELLARMMTMMSAINPASKSNEMLDKVVNVAFDKLLNPTPAGAPVSASAELVRQLPQIGGQVAEGLREFRLAREAELRMMQMQRGQPQQPMASNPQVLPAAPPAPGTPPGAPTMEFVEQKIIEILHQPVSAEQAADDAMAFLSALDPNAVGQIALLGETGMLALFQSKPILKQATNNMPRLVEFIRAFLKMYAEDAAAEASGAQAVKAPPLPN